MKWQWLTAELGPQEHCICLYVLKTCTWKWLGVCVAWRLCFALNSSIFSLSSIVLTEQRNIVLIGSDNKRVVNVRALLL